VWPADRRLVLVPLAKSASIFLPLFSEKPGHPWEEEPETRLISRPRQIEPGVSSGRLFR